MDSDRLILYSGERGSIPLEFTTRNAADEDVPFDLTGAKVFVTAKRSADDQDADAVIAATVTDHADAAAGKTAFPVDLSGATAEILDADIWIEAAGGDRIPAGHLAIQIKPSQRKNFDA